jgi:hypothetical protein
LNPPGDFQIYKRLIKHILGENFHSLNIAYTNIDLIAKFLASESLFYDQLIHKINSKEFKTIVLDTFHIPESISFSEAFIKSLKYFIYKYAGGHCYIASFSKECNNPIMWSHYSNYHTGYCLCFTFENNKIKNNLNSQKHLNNEYNLEVVKYRKNSIKTNGFYTFPAAIFGKSITEVERLKYWLYKIISFLVKSKSWSYEKEYRVIHYDSLTESINDLGPTKRLVGKRIFYYDQNQLTGIILGSKMKSENKEELKNTIFSLRSKLLTQSGFLPIFIFYESLEKNTSEYLMDINPIYALDMFNGYFDIENLAEKEAELEKFKKFSKK